MTNVKFRHSANVKFWNLRKLKVKKFWNLKKFKNLTILKFDICHIFKLGQNLKIWQYWNLTNVKFDNVKSLTILIFDKCKILKLEIVKFWNLTKLKV